MSTHRLCAVLIVLMVLPAASVAWAQEQQQPETVPLSFDNVPIQEAAHQVADMLDRVVVLGEGVEGTVTLSAGVPRDLALAAVAATVSSYPVPAIVFCTEDEARGPVELDTEKAVTLKLEQDTPLSDAASQVTELVGTHVAVTPALADARVTYDCEDLPLVQALDALAAQAECTWVRGFLLLKADPQKAFEDFSRLPVEAQEHLVNMGLDHMARVQLTPEQMDAMFQQGHRQFRSMSPEERARTVEFAADHIREMTGLLHNMTPETQGRVMQALAPVIARGVSLFVELDAAEQAELMPIMNALKGLE
jgi:hypothetical protein